MHKHPLLLVSSPTFTQGPASRPAGRPRRSLVLLGTAAVLTLAGPKPTTLATGLATFSPVAAGAVGPGFRRPRQLATPQLPDLGPRPSVEEMPLPAAPVRSYKVKARVRKVEKGRLWLQ